MFSQEYLLNLSTHSGFKPESLQKQMTLLVILRDIHNDPFFGSCKIIANIWGLKANENPLRHR